jgi:hypothetical protein
LSKLAYMVAARHKNQDLELGRSFDGGTIRSLIVGPGPAASSDSSESGGSAGCATGHWHVTEASAPRLGVGERLGMHRDSISRKLESLLTSLSGCIGLGRARHGEPQASWHCQWQDGAGHMRQLISNAGHDVSVTVQEFLCHDAPCQNLAT